MDKAKLALSGDLGSSSPTVTWSKTGVANDTATLAPATGTFWPAGTKTLIVDGLSAIGLALARQTLSYAVSTTPEITGNPTIASGTVITAHETLKIYFTDSIDTTSVLLSGTIAASMPTPTWTTTTKVDDTMTLNGTNVVTWTAGTAQTLTVNGKSKDGYPIAALNLSYPVFNGVCVREFGNDSGKGTCLSPFGTLQKGIDTAYSWYGVAQVRVAGGTYTNIAVPGFVVELKNGISLLGGYSYNGTDIANNWKNRDTIACETTIADTSVGPAAVEQTPNAAVHIPSTITSPDTASIDGFTIISGKGGGTAAETGANAGIFCEGFATIQNNIIHGQSDPAYAGKFAIGITVKSSSPLISRNNIDAGRNAMSTSNSASYGIYSYSSSPVIDGNTIVGGQGGKNTVGIYIFGSGSVTTIVRNNAVQGGSSTVSSYGIWNYSQDTKIYNNTIDGGSGQNGFGLNIKSGHPEIKNNILFFITSPSTTGYCVYEAATTDIANPSALDNNDFGPAISGCYYDFTYGQIINMTTSITTNESGSPNTLAHWNNIGGDPVIAGGTPTDFHLTSSSPQETRTGGIDGAVAGWGFYVDRTGKTRTGDGSTGWSMGAYEY
jgi:hypothetical protein